jgi:hypothetical protein
VTKINILLNEEENGQKTYCKRAIKGLQSAEDIDLVVFSIYVIVNYT